MAENIYHLESKRVENSVFSHKIGGENGIISKKLHSGDFGIFYPAITSLVETGLKLTQKFFKSAHNQALKICCIILFFKAGLFNFDL